MKVKRMRAAHVRIEHGPGDESRGVCRFFAREPVTRLVNALVHA